LRRKPGQLIAAVAALVLVASATTFAQTSAGQRALGDIGVGGQPSRYTELAFANPSRLPKALHRAPSRVPVEFTITNHGPTETAYRWQVRVMQPVARVLSAGEVYVPRGYGVSVAPAIVLGCSSRTQIAVLLSSGERIDYWADCLPPPARGRVIRPAKSRR